MTEKESFTQQALERIRSGKSQGDSAKKRRISRILLLVDGILVIFLILYFSNRDSSEDIQTAALTFGKIQSRLTLAKDWERGNLISTLTLSNQGKEQTITFINNIATLQVRKNDTILLGRTLGNNVKRLPLASGESRTFSSSIPISELRRAAGHSPDDRVKQRKTLFQFQKDYIPLTLTCTLHTEEELSLDIPLRLEVEE